jgi:hypothetical protein
LPISNPAGSPFRGCMPARLSFALLDGCSMLRDNPLQSRARRMLGERNRKRSGYHAGLLY